MERLPKKEDLLPKTAPTPATGKTEESVAVKQAKDEQLIAEAENKKVEAEIKTQLAKAGYQSLQDALKDAEQKTQEGNRLLDSARQIEETAYSIKEEAEAEKQKAIQALEVLRERTEAVNARLKKAVTIEDSFKSKDATYSVAKQELQELIAYHHTYIRPCVKSLRQVSRAIYTWIDLLNTTKYDFSGLYNYIGRVTKIIDRYLDRVPSRIPYGILNAGADDETEEGRQKKG